MTGYSPDTQDMDSLLTPPEPAATCDRLNDVRKEGPPIPPQMQRIVREVAASQPRSGINHQTKVPAIAGTHTPNMDCKWDYASAQKSLHEHLKLIHPISPHLHLKSQGRSKYQTICSGPTRSAIQRNY
jgi:hypothetical protein